MRDRTGEVWQMNYMMGKPTVLIISSKHSNYADDKFMHRCLVVDTEPDGRYDRGEIRSLGGWNDAMSSTYGWTRLA